MVARSKFRSKLARREYRRIDFSGKQLLSGGESGNDFFEAGGADDEKINVAVRAIVAPRNRAEDEGSLDLV